jgi:hypothetical protein
MDKMVLTPHSEAMATLCRALKLPRDTQAFNLDCKSAFDLPVVTVKYHPENDSDVENHLHSFETITKDFVLTPKDYLDQLVAKHNREMEELRGHVATLRDAGRNIIANEADRTKQLLDLLELNRWRVIPHEMPPIGVYVEALRLSGYTTIKFEVVTAKYDPDYKGWTDVGNNRLTDSGANPMFFRPFPDVTGLS